VADLLESLFMVDDLPPLLGEKFLMFHEHSIVLPKEIVPDVV
jgi:hypothetical protein